MSATLTTYQNPDQRANPADRLNFFFGLWPNRYRSIIRPAGCQNWVTLSKFHQLADEEIYAGIDLSDSSVFGCRWGEQTRFAVLDIDQGSDYHNEIGLARLKQVLAEVGLYRLNLYRSSESGGWHLYIFFDSWEDSKAVSEKLRSWLKKNEFKIRSGQLELFPSGNGLRLPLQKGFAWLDQGGKVVKERSQLSTEQAIEAFLSDLRNSDNHWESSMRVIENQLEKDREPTNFKDLEAPEDFAAFFDRSGLIPEVYERGRLYWTNGLTDFGQRHDAIYCLGHYLWYGDEFSQVRPIPGASNATLRAQIISEWLLENHGGFSEAINLDRWSEVEADIKRACSWTREEAKDRICNPYPLTERLIERLAKTKVFHVDDFRRANEKRQQDARKRIKEAVELCISTNRQIGRNALAEISGCSPNTVSKHSDLWRCLTTGSCEYSVPDQEFLSVSSEVAPLLSFLAEEPTTSPQCQNQDLEAGLVVLTPGPKLRGLLSGKAGVPGGLFVCSSVGSLGGPASKTNKSTLGSLQGRKIQSLSIALLDLSLDQSVSQDDKRFFSKCLKDLFFLFFRNRNKGANCSNEQFRLEAGRLSTSEAKIFKRSDCNLKKSQNSLSRRCCSGCTQLLDKGFKVLHYNRTRGPPEG